MSPLRIAAWALPLLVLLALAWSQLAASRSDPAAPPPASAAAIAIAAADAHFPRAVRTPDGGELVLSRAPRRVLIANTSLVDMVAALIEPERIVALPRQALTWSTLARDAGRLADLPTFPEFVAEAVLAHRPDLVLCSVHSQPETVASLLQVGVPTVRFGFPEDLAAVRADLRLCANLLGADERLATLDAELDARIAALAADPGERTGVRAAFYTHDGNEGWSSGRRTAADEVLTLAGMRNATGMAGLFGPTRLTFEQLVAMDPDLLVIPEAGGEVDASTERVFADELGALRAVRTGRIVRLHPSLFSTTSHEVVTAAEVLARAVDELLRRPAAGERR